MENSLYIGTPYPQGGEFADLADVPTQLRQIAYSWENTFGGVWLDWNPVVTQSSTQQPAAMTIDLTTSVRRVRKVGRTVSVIARLDVSVGTGLSGYPLIYLPYVMADAEACAGIVTWLQGASASSTAALSPLGGPSALNPGVIEVFGNSTARAAGDWFGLLLEYETV